MPRLWNEGRSLFLIRFNYHAVLFFHIIDLKLEEAVHPHAGHFESACFNEVHSARGAEDLHGDLEAIYVILFENGSLLVVFEYWIVEEVVSEQIGRDDVLETFFLKRWKSSHELAFECVVLVVKLGIGPWCSRFANTVVIQKDSSKLLFS